jgi:hypothetical protein
MVQVVSKLTGNYGDSLVSASANIDSLKKCKNCGGFDHTRKSSAKCPFNEVNL